MRSEVLPSYASHQQQYISMSNMPHAFGQLRTCEGLDPNLLDTSSNDSHAGETDITSCYPYSNTRALGQYQAGQLDISSSCGAITSCASPISSNYLIDDLSNISNIDPTSFLHPPTALPNPPFLMLPHQADGSSQLIPQDQSAIIPSNSVAGSFDSCYPAEVVIRQSCSQSVPLRGATQPAAQTSMHPPKCTAATRSGSNVVPEEEQHVKAGTDEGQQQQLHHHCMGRSNRINNNILGVASMQGMAMVKGSLGGSSLGASHDASCMEQLLVHCATAVEGNDATLAQQLMWVLNNIASVEGDPNQRVAAHFLRALIARAAARAPGSGAPNLGQVDDTKPGLNNDGKVLNKKMTAIELAGFVDLTPWHRFGFCAANGAIMEAIEGAERVHIVDFSMTHGMQWPTLIEALSKRGGPEVVLTMHAGRPEGVGPGLAGMGCEEVGARLAAFARGKGVRFTFRVVGGRDMCSALQAAVAGRDAGREALVINCQMRLRYEPCEDDDMSSSSSHSPPSPQPPPRASFLRLARSLCPALLALVDEDADLCQASLPARLRAAFNYLWIPFDALDSFLPRRACPQRLLYEADVAAKILNIVACDGPARIERLESKDRWIGRLRSARLRPLPFSDAIVADVRSMLDEHAAGWGLKRSDTDYSLSLTWKGHNVVFATCCVAAAAPTSTTSQD